MSKPVCESLLMKVGWHFLKHSMCNYEALYHSCNYLHKSWYDWRKAYSYSLEGLDSFTFYSVFFQIQNDPELKNKLKAQALIYPGLQVIDLSLPSHQEFEHGPLLSKKLAIRLACLYLTQDKALPQAMMKNQHMPHGSMHLFKLVNWSTLLPEKYKKNHVYTEPILGRLNPSYSILLDSRLSPLAVNDSQLQNLPLTYILTCQHDILRDDGLMYVSRLRNAGVKVSHDHMEDGIHGALSFMTWPVYLQLGIRVKDKYINWLEENL